MSEQRLKAVIHKYRPYGVVRGREFLLPPPHAIALIDEVVECGILLFGCDLWRYWDAERRYVVELVGAGFLVDESECDAARSAALIKDFLIRRLPEDAELVSLISQDGILEDMFVHEGA